MGVQPFYAKRVFEKITIGLDFTDDIPSGVTISSGVASAKKRYDNSDATSALLADGTTVTVSGLTGSIVVSAGAVGTWYEVYLQMQLSDGQKREGMALVFVDQ